MWRTSTSSARSGPLLRMVDGSVRTPAEPVADSDADLIAQLQYVAAHHGGAERAFSPAQPCLNMQLPDGSRLAAMRDVVPHPTVTIRRHRLRRRPPGRPGRARDARRRGRRRFLHRAGRARGATSWSPACRPRARPPCCARWPGRSRRRERVATLETEYELGLHRLPGTSPLLVAMECRPGSTEVDPATGRRAGEITLSDLLHQTLRMSVTRVIVGEVRGAEALPMLEAMNAGMPGSMCTLHAGSATDAMERLVTAALQGRRAGLVGHLRHPPGRPGHRLRRAPAPPRPDHLDHPAIPAQPTGPRTGGALAGGRGWAAAVRRRDRRGDRRQRDRAVAMNRIFAARPRGSRGTRGRCSGWPRSAGGRSTRPGSTSDFLTAVDPDRRQPGTRHDAGRPADGPRACGDRDGPDDRWPGWPRGCGIAAAVGVTVAGRCPGAARPRRHAAGQAAAAAAAVAAHRPDRRGPRRRGDPAAGRGSRWRLIGVGAGPGWRCGR